MIEWNKSLEIGVPEIDQQHRELVRRFNCFCEAVHKHVARENVVEFLLFMQTYALFHFAEEEALMHKIGYPGIDAHILEHDLFRGKHFWLQEGLRFDEVKVCEEIMGFVEGWICNHVVGADMKISEYMARLARKA